MIGSLHGKITHVTIGQVLLEVHGVGYIVYIPESRDEEIFLGKEITLFTHLAVREDSLTLYGFISEYERKIFELLISVSGVGPKIGLAILSAYTPVEIQSAISSAKPEVFSAVSGIGKKNAERIILELKGKIGLPEGLEQVATSSSGELTAALSALGYSVQESVRVSQSIDASQALSDQIKQALALLNKNK